MKTLFLSILLAAGALVAGGAQEPSPGSYAGVIRHAAHDDHQHAGLFVARFGTRGVFTARVSWQGFGYSLRGALSPAGVFHGTLRKAGGGTFTVDLDAAAAPGKIMVAVTDGALTSGTDARPALYGHGSPSPWHPKYNGVANHYPDLGFPPNTDGLVRVSPHGSVRYLARLGDGTICSAGSFLVADDPTIFPNGTSRVIGDRFPLYTGLYRGATRGSVWGDGNIVNLTLIPNFHSPFVYAAGGSLQWHRPAQPNGPQPNTAGQGGVFPFVPEYYAPAPGEPVVPLGIPPLPAGQLFLSAGDLEEGIVVPLDWNATQQFVPRPNAFEVRLFTNVGEGLFTGTFRHPVTRRRVAFNGVYRPLAGAIGGFMGPDHAGEVSILGYD